MALSFARRALPARHSRALGQTVPMPTGVRDWGMAKFYIIDGNKTILFKFIIKFQRKHII
jgi:hypothetical protein